MKKLVLALGAILALATPGLAQTAAPQGHDGHPGHAQSSAASPADEAYRQALAKMHRDMDFPLTSKPDLDFIRGMIAHHQGAIDMAQVVLKYGSNPDVRALAQAIVKAQEAEVVWMKEWLAKNGG